MHYLILCCFDEAAWERLPETQRADVMQRYHEWHDEQRATGRYLTGAKLQSTASATTLRVGENGITDGPFAETKEQLGGYHLLACRDLDEALAIADGIPTLPHGGVVEVRPVAHVLPGSLGELAPVSA